MSLRLITPPSKLYKDCRKLRGAVARLLRCYEEVQVLREDPDYVKSTMADTLASQKKAVAHARKILKETQ